MPRRVPIRLVRLLAVASACVLMPGATAQAVPPDNDLPGAAQVVTNLLWTSLSAPQDVVVQATDWGDATTGAEDGDPPSCTSAIGFRSMWYRLDVPEAAVLRVTVVSTDTARYQPVVTIIDASRNEVACGLAATGKPGATANATAYVTPLADGVQSYLIRVAQVINNSPSGGLPTLTVRFAARDVTAPHIRVESLGTVQPGVNTVYDAEGTTDLASLVDTDTANWEFHERINGNDVVKRRKGMRPTYKWLSSGVHIVTFDVADRAGNKNMYKFTTFVQDTVRPVVSFSLRPPEPGARRLRVVVDASESVRVKLLVTQVGRSGPLLRRFVRFWGTGEHARSIPLRGRVGRGLLLVSGVARDGAGNATALPQCVVDPVTGQGSCTSP